RDLRLLRDPWNLACWVSLSESIRMIGGINLSHPYSTPQQVTGTMNVASCTKHIVEWCIGHGKKPDLPLSRFRCTRQDWEDLAQAFEISQNYVQFCRVFPRWHEHQYAAELISDMEVRFTS